MRRATWSGWYVRPRCTTSRARSGTVRDAGAMDGLGALAAFLHCDASYAKLSSWAVAATDAVFVAGDFAQGALAVADERADI